MNTFQKLLPAVFVSFSFLFIQACNEKETLTPEPSLEGRWEWVQSYGGFAGDLLQTPATTGRNVDYIFEEKGLFLEIINGDTTQVTDYLVQEEMSLLFNQPYEMLTINFIISSPEADSVVYLPMRHIIRELSDTLVLQEDVFDGFELTFARK